jgi:hypothetical protein
VEVSDNLIEWRPARPNEIAVTRKNQEITVEFLGEDPALFVRINSRQIAK